MCEAFRHLLLENQMSHSSHASHTSHPQAESKARSTSHPTTTPTTTTNNTNKKGNNMKLEIDWAGMLKAALKAVWPFIAGAVGGLFTGCTIAGIGPNFL